MWGELRSGLQRRHTGAGFGDKIAWNMGERSKAPVMGLHRDLGGATTVPAPPLALAVYLLKSYIYLNNYFSTWPQHYPRTTHAILLVFINFPLSSLHPKLPKNRDGILYVCVPPTLFCK